MSKLAGKVAVVTGAASGIGEASFITGSNYVADGGLTAR